jgi:uracil-DNA glycosylase
MSKPLAIVVPIRTVSAPNVREHHMARARRVKSERWAVGMMLNAHKPPPMPVLVLLGRVARSHVPLDDDNLRGALKAVRDEVARWLGVDDGDARVVWRYAQKTGSPRWEVAIAVGPLLDDLERVAA